MKKIVLVIVAVLLLALAFVSWKFLGPATSFEGKKYFLLIKTGSTYNDVKETLAKDHVINSPWFFEMAAQKLDYPQKVKAGRYEINSGMSLVSMLRMLRNGRQAPVNLVITKIRTKEDLAGIIGRKFETDSLTFLEFLNNNDSLKHYGLDSNTSMCAVMPNTYTYFWNSNTQKIFSKLYDAYSGFWTAQRKKLADSQKLTPHQVITLASIIDEETNKADEKGNIASVYMNRMAKGMRLAADPTVKFALKDFGLKRVYNKHLAVESPYNTYKIYGLPPGPICTPQTASIDAVLHAPKTDYLFFVASSDFSGSHRFAATYDEHLKYAKSYQLALDTLTMKKGAAKEDTGN